MLKRPWFALSRHDEGETVEPITPAEGGETQKASFTPIESQEDFDKRIAARVGRERAKYSDYESLKEKAARLETLEAEKLTAEEKATARAEAAERSAAERDQKTSIRIATVELKAALTGLVENPADIIEDLDLTKFIGADGEVDEAAVAKVKAKYAALAKKANIPSGSLDQGPLGDGKTFDYRTADPAATKAALAAIGVSSW